jgi:hypothetical protein
MRREEKECNQPFIHTSHANSFGATESRQRLRCERVPPWHAITPDDVNLSLVMPYLLARLKCTNFEEKSLGLFVKYYFKKPK